MNLKIVVSDLSLNFGDLLIYFYKNAVKLTVMQITHLDKMPKAR